MVASALTHSPVPHLLCSPKLALSVILSSKHMKLSHVRALPMLFSLLEHPEVLNSGLPSQSKVTFSRLTVKLCCLDCGAGMRTDTLADGKEESTEGHWAWDESSTSANSAGPDRVVPPPHI